MTCADGRIYAARHVLAGVAPAVLGELLGEPVERPEGAQVKINMLLKRLPRVPGVSSEQAFTGTFHVNEGYEQLAAAYREASTGAIPSTPPCEVYCHSLTDPSILGDDLRRAGVHTLTLFGLHMPARLFDPADAAAKERAVAATLASINSVLAEPIEECLLGLEALTPPESRPSSACRAATSSTATSPGRSPSQTKRSAPGASRPRTRTCGCAAPARAAVAASAASRATTPLARSSKRRGA